MTEGELKLNKAICERVLGWAPQAIPEGWVDASTGEPITTTEDPRWDSNLVAKEYGPQCEWWRDTHGNRREYPDFHHDDHAFMLLLDALTKAGRRPVLSYWETWKATVWGTNGGGVDTGAMHGARDPDPRAALVKAVAKAYGLKEEE